MVWCEVVALAACALWSLVVRTTPRPHGLRTVHGQVTWPGHHHYRQTSDRGTRHAHVRLHSRRVPRRKHGRVSLSDDITYFVRVHLVPVRLQWARRDRTFAKFRYSQFETTAQHLTVDAMFMLTKQLTKNAKKSIRCSYFLVTHHRVRVQWVRVRVLKNKNITASHSLIHAYDKYNTRMIRTYDLKNNIRVSS